MNIVLVGFGKVGQAIYRAVKGNPAYQGLHFVAIVDQRFGQGLNPPPEIMTIAVERSSSISWRNYTPDLVIDATRPTPSRSQVQEYLNSGAPRVVVTASLPDPDITLITGVNEEKFDPFQHLIISASSCTAVCLAPVVKILAEKFGIRRVNVEIQHGFDPQNIASTVDLPRAGKGAQKKLQKGKKVPYRTNFVRNVETILPNLAGKLSAKGYYLGEEGVLFLPTVFAFQNKITEDQIHDVLIEAAEGKLKGILQYCNAYIDELGKYIPNKPFSTIFFPWNTTVKGKTAYLYFAGDYVFGYAVRVLDLVRYIDLQLKSIK